MESDWLIDLHWVQALTVPLNLGLIDGPFVPHNLISAQESPVPLPKFQMAPRLKTLMSSGSMKGTQIYYPFLSKSPNKRIPSSFPKRASMERDIHLQGIFTSLLIYLFISKALRKQHPSMFSKSRAPVETDAHSRDLLTYLSGSPVKEPSLQVPLIESPQREMSCSYSPPSFTIQSPQHRSPLPDSRFPSDIKGPLWREMPISGAFLNMSSSVPSKGALPRGPPYWVSSERNAPFLEAPSSISQSPR